ncbi:MAG TPA: outer membrane beta-barrel protein [Terracidiphilus sp.]|nr:outer membrane beta-barrel protein [Terracidiphilus sp.]
MKKFLAIAAIAAMIPVSALAQAAAQNKNDTTNWTGFYAGLYVGGAIGSSNAQTATVYSSTGYFATTSVPAIAITGNQNLNYLGAVGGAQFGYNWQFAPKWVLGAVVDYGAFKTSGSATGTTVYPCCSPTTFTITQNVTTSWMATIRPRVGYTVGKRSLLFISGGAAETQLNYSSLFTDTFASANESASASVLKTGWTIGGGGEYALDKHWSLGAEYLYVDFGSIQNAGTVLTTISGGGDPSWPSNVFTHTAILTGNIARFNVNYRF